MHLSQIRIKNFRLFQNLELALNKGLNVLVGENDSGKTALLDAIRHVLGTNSNDRMFITEQDFCNDESELKIQLKFEDVDKYAHKFVEHLSHEKYEENGRQQKKAVLYIALIAKKTGKERRGYPYIQTDVRSGYDGDLLP